MLTHYLTCIHLFLRENKEFTTILQFVDSISKCSTTLHSDNRTIGTTFYVSFERLIFLKAVRHDSLTCRSCQNIRTKTDDTTRRHIKLKVDAFTGILHHSHLTFTAGYHIDDLT